MRPLHLIAGVTLTAFTGVALAQPSDNQKTSEDDIIVSVWSHPSTCNLDVAKKVSLEALVRKPSAWTGKCIAVRGYWYGRALFDYQSDADRKYSQSSDEIDGHRVGIYARDEILNAAPKHAALFIAVGIANECERLWNGSVMVMGYCHYTGGPFIAVAEMRPR
jgi:hypothetical protein